MNLNEWIDLKLHEISLRLPFEVHEDPASFACGYNSGYKSAILDLKDKLDMNEIDYE